MHGENAGVAPWSGALAMADGALCFVGALSDAAGHRHVATQIMIARSGSFELADGHGRRAVTSTAIIPSSCEHSIRVPGDAVSGVLVFLDTGSALGSRVAELAGGSADVARWVAAGHVFVSTIGLTSSDPAAVLQVIAGAYRTDQSGTAHPWHASVRHAIDRITETLPAPVTLSAIADSVGLSPSRLSRLFNDQVGQSFPAYVRWRRLRLAVEALQQGASLTDASHAAGFTDSAHANRVCHEMFGMSPSRASRHLVWR